MPLCEFYDILNGRPRTGDLSEKEFRSTYEYGGRMGDIAFIYSVHKDLFHNTTAGSLSLFILDVHIYRFPVHNMKAHGESVYSSTHS
jgi:hypothetical protein